MQTGLQAEVLLCPNCKEEVPKTLYCLNCGYPLYKIDLDQPEEDVEVVVDEALEPVEDEDIVKVETIEDVVIMVEDMAASPAEETKEDETEDETELVEAVVPVEITEFVAEAEPVVEIEAVPEVAEEIIEPVVEVEAVPEVAEEIIEPVVEVVEPPAEDVLEIPLEESVESVETSVFEVVGGPEIEDVEKVEEAELIIEIVDVPEPSYEPDPVIREVLENFGKNISMKIRLVRLFKDGGVKAEIFERLFESYVARGELLMNSRSKMLERVTYDLDSMGRALNEAKAGLEELEIRRAISDVSDEEYAAKAPGFEWDIGQYEDEVGRKKAEIAYLEDITRVMSEEEITELIEIGEGCLDFVDSDEMGSEMAGRVKISLEEALTCLRA